MAASDDKKRNGDETERSDETENVEAHAPLGDAPLGGTSRRLTAGKD